MAVESAAIIEVESLIASLFISVVVVVSVVAGFESHEVRAAANTKARADNFRRFFIVVSGCKSCLKTSFIPECSKSNLLIENKF